ncbi:DUF6484 domain-containing protein [Hahella aquimaris]|uniref:DUF6484 domain-containing protein n=1 Tax=Hahella sp. HNIBRBA332 TaxID=3015983 RepID=UPI00273AAB57|nr:DUF6484 domain-containing protein [Hahella sp. HNIBRBA332]WLQ17141.1 DUF6484 domain-containing protein [Hahella sp. HNIBRBA332]
MGAVNELFESVAETAATPIIGKLVEVDAKGRAWIDFPGNSEGALLAKTTITLPPSQAVPGQQLLMLFEGGRKKSPVIIGVVGEALVPNESQTVVLPVGKTDGAVIDGKKVRFDARDEIQLVCGKSSILLRADGKVVIKGKDILNRAMSSNKIKGANVAIN